MGLGDVKLLAMIGAVLGPLGVFQTILLASLADLAFGLVWAAIHRSLRALFGFGPGHRGGSAGGTAGGVAPLPGALIGGAA